MTFVDLTAEDEPQIARLLAQARHVYADAGREDLREFLRAHVAVAGYAASTPWGFLAIQVEERPATLPTDAPDRAYLRFVALAANRSPQVDISALYAFAWSRVRTRAAHIQVQAYGRERWIGKPLTHAGFHLAERIEFLRLDSLQQRALPRLDSENCIRCRAATPDDLPLLAQLDAQAFPPRWHFGERDLFSLLMSGHLQLALRRSTVVGYWAMNFTPDGDAYLARLAVHHAYQSQGIGRTLLADALAYARKEGSRAVMLNTQTDNRHAQHLYRAVGFRPTGHTVPILTHPDR